MKETLSHNRAHYLGDPAPKSEEPDCKSFDCPVLTEKDYKSPEGKITKKAAYCGMYAKYLSTSKAGVIKPCAQCFRERPHLWRLG